MKKNKGNFKRAIDELLNSNGGSSDEMNEEEMEQEPDSDSDEIEEIQETESQKYYNSGRKNVRRPETTAFAGERTEERETFREEDAMEEDIAIEEDTDDIYSAPEEETPVYEAVITPDVIINGNIIAGSNLKILGRIFGNVDCKGAIILSGNIEGDVSARNLQFMAGGIQGNVSIGEDITTDKGTQVRGDVSAQTAVLSGDMQGELLVRGDLELRSTSTVLGNIKARAISINSGSRIKGMLDVGGDPEEEETAYEE